MVMMTGNQYRQSLVDGRRSYIDGELVKDPSLHPMMKGAVDMVAATYDRFYSEEPGAYHPMYLIPRSREDLEFRMEAVSRSDVTAGVMSSVMALVTVAPELAQLKPEYRERVYEFMNYCQVNDIRCSEAITDAKGDRVKRPSRQFDPDQYVHVVDRQRDGIVISGAKCHITAAPLCHEQVVLPTKAMKTDEEEYAVACAVPSNAEGLHIVNTTNAPRSEDQRHFPLSSHRNCPDGLLVFDNVFVPWERVFLDGETSHAQLLAHALGLWERSAGIAHVGDNADRLVGFANLLVEANGNSDRKDIRDLLAEMAIYATMCRAGWEAAVKNAVTNDDGTISPSSLYVSATKYYDHELHQRMMDILHDLAGPLMVSAPTVGDIENEEVAADLAEHLAGASGWSVQDRMKLLHYLRDTTADTYGGWSKVAGPLSGGGQFAQRLVALRNYDLVGATRRARETLGLDPGPGGREQRGGQS